MEEIRRIDIKTGYLCNNFCKFCAQGHHRHLGNRTTQEIITDLENARKKNFNGVVFTGGEVTIRKDLFELIDVAYSLGFEIIQLQTNGRMFSKEEFVKECIKHGVNEFGPSLHGYLPEIHDYLTSAPGSWKQTVQGIKNIKKHNKRVIMNSVVVKSNYRHIPELAKLFVNLGVDQYQFAFVHACGNAWKNFDKVVAYKTLVKPFMKMGLQIGIDAGIGVMSEAMPYCMMRGYERYIGELYMPQTAVREKEFYIEDFDSVRKNELKLKFPQCKECRFRLICEGPWKEYPERRGYSEFKPVKGRLIKSTDEIFENEYEFPINPLKKYGKKVFYM